MVPVNAELLHRMMSGGMAEFLATYNVAINLFLAFAMLTSIFVLVLNIVKLGTAKDHPLHRSAAIAGILVSGVCTGLLTMSSVIYVFLLQLL